MNQVATLSLPVLAVLVCLLFLPCGTCAQDGPAWAPPEPAPKSLDWIRLTSGEWLRGTIDLMRDEKLYFDSKELDDLTLDWEDVDQIRSSRLITYVFSGKRVLVGTAVMKDGVLVIRTETETVEVSRRDLQSIVETAARELDYWNGKISVGYAQRSGNTNQIEFNSRLAARRESAHTRITLDYSGNLSSLDDRENTNNHRGSTSFSYVISKNFFVTLVGVTLFSDRFQNISLRSDVGAGVGLYIVRNSHLEFNIQLGAGRQKTEYRSVEPGQEISESSATLLPATEFDWDITGDVELKLSYEAMVGIPDTDLTTHHGYAGISIDLISIIDLDVSSTWDHVQNPKADSEGVVPKQNDFKVSLGLAIDY